MFRFPTAFRQERFVLPDYEERRAGDGFPNECPRRCQCCQELSGLAMAYARPAANGAGRFCPARGECSRPRWRARRWPVRFERDAPAQGDDHLRGRTEELSFSYPSPTWKLSTSDKQRLPCHSGSVSLARPGKEFAATRSSGFVDIDIYIDGFDLTFPLARIQTSTMQSPIASQLRVLGDELKDKYQRPLPAPITCCCRRRYAALTTK